MRLVRVVACLVALPGFSAFLFADDSENFSEFVSPDGVNRFYTLDLTSTPGAEQDNPEEIYLITGGRTKPHAARWPDYDPPLAAWTGSSKYLVVSGQKYGPDFLAYRQGDEWLTREIDDKPLRSLGEKLVPFREINAPVVHEAITELRSAPGDSVLGLFYKNQDPQAVIITFLLRVHENNGRVWTDFEIHRVIPIKSPQYPLPSLLELEKK